MAYHRALANGYVLSDDISSFDFAAAQRWIGVESYWAKGIPAATLEKAVRNSLTFSIAVLAAP